MLRFAPRLFAQLSLIVRISNSLHRQQVQNLFLNEPGSPSPINRSGSGTENELNVGGAWANFASVSSEDSGNADFAAFGNFGGDEGAGGGSENAGSGGGGVGFAAFADFGGGGDDAVLTDSPTKSPSPKVEESHSPKENGAAGTDDDPFSALMK